MHAAATSTGRDAKSASARGNTYAWLAASPQAAAGHEAEAELRAPVRVAWIVIRGSGLALRGIHAGLPAEAEAAPARAPEEHRRRTARPPRMEPAPIIRRRRRSRPAAPGLRDRAAGPLRSCDRTAHRRAHPTERGRAPRRAPGRPRVRARRPRRASAGNG